MPPKKQVSAEAQKQADALYKKHVNLTVKQLNFVARKLRTRYRGTYLEYQDFAKLSRNSYLHRLMELAGGAKLPTNRVVGRARKGVIALEKAIKSKNWSRIPQALKTADIETARFRNAQNRYFKDFSGGANRAIVTAKIGQTAGFISLGVLCVTFAGGPVALATTLEAGTAGSAAVAASTGGMLSGALKSFAKDAGRAIAGEDVGASQVIVNAVKGSLFDGVLGLICGPLANGLGKKIARSAAGSAAAEEIAVAVSETTKVHARIIVGATKKAIVDLTGPFVTRHSRDIAKKIALKLKGTETKAQVDAITSQTVVEDPRFKKEVKEAVTKKLAKEKEKAR